MAVDDRKLFKILLHLNNTGIPNRLPLGENWTCHNVRFLCVIYICQCRCTEMQMFAPDCNFQCFLQYVEVLKTNATEHRRRFQTLTCFSIVLFFGPFACHKTQTKNSTEKQQDDGVVTRCASELYQIVLKVFNVNLNLTLSSPIRDTSLRIRNCTLS